MNIYDSDFVDFGRSECSVRVNSADSGLCGEDLKVVLGGENMGSGGASVCVERGGEDGGGGEIKVGLIMIIETARSINDIAEIYKTARDLAPVTLLFALYLVQMT